MTEKLQRYLAGDKVYAVAQRMQNGDLHALPVVDNHKTKKLIGVITDGELLRLRWRSALMAMIRWGSG
jgi:CBS-domain-containing membrane protein